MDFTEEQYGIIENLAGTGYSVRRIAMYLDVNSDVLVTDYDDPESKFRYHYDRGVLKCEAERDLALQVALTAGNVTALQILEKKLEQRKMNGFKEDLLSGHI